MKHLLPTRWIYLDFRFQTQIGGWMQDHWEITVIKLPKNGRNVSVTYPVMGMGCGKEGQYTSSDTCWACPMSIRRTVDSRTFIILS
jgi:hypothetical protein